MALITLHSGGEGVCGCDGGTVEKVCLAAMVECGEGVCGCVGGAVVAVEGVCVGAVERVCVAVMKCESSCSVNRSACDGRCNVNIRFGLSPQDQTILTIRTSPALRGWAIFTKLER